MINPVLTEMAVYPFTRLEEERRRLAGRRRRGDRLRQGRPERADRSDDPAARSSTRCPSGRRTRWRRGCPSCARRPQAGSGAASASPSTPRREIVPTYGSKEAIFSLAQVLGTAGRVVAFGEPAYPVYERGALVRRRARADAAAATRERLPARSRRARRRRRARLGQLPAQPDRRGRAARVLRRARGGGRAPRLRGRAPTRRTRSSGSTSRRRRRCRRPTARASSSSRR